VILAGVAVIVAVIVVLAMTGRGGAQFPDQVGGYARLTTPQATQIEDFISNTSVAGMHMRGAVYGSGAGPTFVVVVITDGLPPGSSLDSILGRLPNGGGGLDQAGLVRASRDGVDYACGRTTSGSASGCIFRGDVIGAVSFVSPADPTFALAIAEEAYKSLT